ncbi:hypothetical protein ACOMHN_026445 [Nucella lapillus]
MGGNDTGLCRRFPPTATQVCAGDFHLQRHRFVQEIFTYSDTGLCRRFSPTATQVCAGDFHLQRHRFVQEISTYSDTAPSVVKMGAESTSAVKTTAAPGGRVHRIKVFTQR